MIVCAVTNIILDLVFVIVFHMGVSGVAYATIISQWISAILVLSILTKETNAYKLVWKDLRIDKATTLSILRIGFPAGLQMAVTSFSNVFVHTSTTLDLPAWLDGPHTESSTNSVYFQFRASAFLSLPLSVKILVPAI